MAVLSLFFLAMLYEDDTRAMYLEHKSLLDLSSCLKQDLDGPPRKKLKYCDQDTVSVTHVIDNKT